MIASNKSGLLVRADGSKEVGIGHVMRCLSIGIAWRKANGPVALASAWLSESLERTARAAGLQVIRLQVTPGSEADHEATQDAALKAGATWVVLDGYGFGVSFQDSLRATGFKVLAVDDVADAPAYHADILLNGNVQASTELYGDRILANTRLLMGPGFAPLKPNFAARATSARSLPETATRLLISLGGGANDELLGVILEALRLINSVRLEVTILPGASDLRTLASASAKSPHEVTIVDSDVADMATYMEAADMALLGGGGTFLEAACLGVPSIIIVIADNQAPACELLQRQGTAVVLGHASTLAPVVLAGSIEALSRDSNWRCRMSACARGMVDGRGAERVVATMMAMAA